MAIVSQIIGSGRNLDKNKQRLVVAASRLLGFGFVSPTRLSSSCDISIQPQGSENKANGQKPMIDPSHAIHLFHAARSGLISS